MTINSQGRKKSNFPGLSSIPDGATLDFVSGSTNYKITKANFLAALGVTGTLVPAGSVTAVPVLQTAGSVFTIRGLEDGAGITVSVSPSDGIKIDNNFTQEGTYTALVSDLTAASPVLASLKAGTGISVAKVGNIITLSASGALPHAIVTMQGNTTATTIGSASAAVLAAGVWAGGTVGNFTASTGGRLTYTGAETANITIDASITLKRAVGTGEIDVAAIIYKNGIAVTASKRVTSCTDSASSSVSLPYIVEMAQNDYIELYVANEETADDITVTDATFRALTGTTAGGLTSALFGAPPVGVGSVTPSTGAFTTLAASAGLSVSGGAAIVGNSTVTGTLGVSGLTSLGTAFNNFVTAKGNTGFGPVLSSSGSETNVPLYISTKGTGQIGFYTNDFNAGGGIPQFQINHTASSNRYVIATGSNGGNPSISASAGNLAVGTNAWTFGTANAVSPTSPNRTLTVTIGGTTYYIHAKTTND